LVAITDETGKTERFKSQSMTVSRTPADYLCSTYNYLSNMKKKTAITNQPGFKTPVSQNSLFFPQCTNNATTLRIISWDEREVHMGSANYYRDKKSLFFCLTACQLLKPKFNYCFRLLTSRYIKFAVILGLF